MPSTTVDNIRTIFSKPFVQILIIILSGTLVYSNTFHVPFVFDDYHAIVDNKKIDSLSTFLSSSPFNSARWFAFATFAFNKGISDTDVTGFHVFNLIIHLLTGITLYALVKSTLRTFGEDTLQRYASAPVTAAVAFVLHPIHTQSVTYIVQRMTSLATLLYMAAILLYARCFTEDTAAAGSIRFRRPLLYLLAVISCLLAMSTKEISFTLPAALILFDTCFLEGTARERILRIVPFIFVALVLFCYLVGMERSLDVMSRGGGDAVSYAPPRMTYLITQFSVLCTYLRLLILPIGQNLDYDYPVFYSLLKPQPAASFVLIVSLLCGAVYLLRRSYGDSCRSPALLRISGFSVVWFLITVSVESGLVPLIDKIFEHRVYLPSVWFFILFGMLVCEWYRCAEAYRTAVISLVIVLMVLSGYATYRRNHVWRDTLSLWSDVVSKSPEKERGWTSLGVYFVNQMDPARAVPMLEHAVKLSPDYYVAHAWLGRALSQRGEHNRALDHYLITTRLAPHYSKGWELAGRLLLENGQATDAVCFLGRAREIDPDGFVSQGYLEKAMVLERQQHPSTPGIK